MEFQVVKILTTAMPTTMFEFAHFLNRNLKKKNNHKNTVWTNKAAAYIHRSWVFAYYSSLKIVFQLTSFPHNGDVRVGLHDRVNGQKLFM